MSLDLVVGASNALLLLDLRMLSVRNQYHWPVLTIRRSSKERFDVS